MRRILVLAAVAVVAVALLWPRTSATPPRPSDEAAREATAPSAAAPDPALEQARQKMLAMKAAMEVQPGQRRVLPSSPERRPGEPEVFYQERKRALLEFERFAGNARLTPAEQESMMQIFADAQDTWRLGLEKLGRRQPEAPGSEMADPLLTALFQPINEEAMRRARGVIDPARAAVLQSFIPTVLPYIRTQTFETIK